MKFNFGRSTVLFSEEYTGSAIFKVEDPRLRLKNCYCVLSFNWRTPLLVFGKDLRLEIHPKLLMNLNSVLMDSNLLPVAVASLNSRDTDEPAKSLVGLTDYLASETDLRTIVILAARNEAILRGFFKRNGLQFPEKAVKFFQK